MKLNQAWENLEFFEIKKNLLVAFKALRMFFFPDIQINQSQFLNIHDYISHKGNNMTLLKFDSCF